MFVAIPIPTDSPHPRVDASPRSPEPEGPESEGPKEVFLLFEKRRTLGKTIYKYQHPDDDYREDRFSDRETIARLLDWEASDDRIGYDSREADPVWFAQFESVRTAKMYWEYCDKQSEALQEFNVYMVIAPRGRMFSPWKMRGLHDSNSQVPTLVFTSPLASYYWDVMKTEMRSVGVRMAGIPPGEMIGLYRESLERRLLEKMTGGDHIHSDGTDSESGDGPNYAQAYQAYVNHG